MDRSNEEGWLKRGVVGVATALAVAGLMALLDWLVLTSFAVGAEVPVEVRLGVVGRVFLTHAVFVLPLLLLVAAVVALLAPKLRLARGDGAVLAACILIEGIVVGYGSIAQKGSLPLGPVTVTPALVLIGTLVGALVVGALVHRLTGTRWQARWRRLLYVVAALALALFAASPMLLRGTPLAGPSAYHAPAPARRALLEPRDGPPNVLFVVLDTVRADHLGLYGYPLDTTPFLAELAERAVTFDRAAAPGIYTYPSHASMFTGLAVREHGFGAKPEINRLDPRFETFAERARAAGYRTAAFSCNPCVDDAQDLLQGFDRTVRVWGTWPWSNSFLRHWLVRFGLEPPAEFVEADCGAAMLSCLAADWIEHEYEPERPFLAFFNYMEAHRDLLPPRADRERFLQPDELARSYELERDAPVLVAADSDYWIVPEGSVDAKDLAISRALYDASLRYQDGRLRELLGLFEQAGLLENTIVIVVSDHGEGLGEHGIYQHHSCVYDILARVPLLVWTPKYPMEGRRVGAPVSTSYLYDLVCAAISGEAVCDAESLARALVERSSGGPVVTECALVTPMAERRAPEFGIEPGTGILRTFQAVTGVRRKYILASDGEEQLFDVASDPLELNDLAADQPNLLAPFEKALRAWLEVKQPRYGAGASEELEPDPERKRLLESLGYTGD